VVPLQAEVPRPVSLRLPAGGRLLISPGRVDYCFVIFRAGSPLTQDDVDAQPVGPMIAADAGFAGVGSQTLTGRNTPRESP
jgi:hypothetical protein